MVEHDVVAHGSKGLHALSDRSIINLIHAVGGHLGDEHLRDEGQALVERRVHAGND